MKHLETFVGIDVGGAKKGFHCVALSSDRGLDARHFDSHDEVVDWLRGLVPRIVAIDAPCKWAKKGSSSREAERSLHKDGIHCFFSPDQDGSRRPKKANWNYDWIKQGRKIYDALSKDYPLFVGGRERKALTIETFPHGVASALSEVPLSGNSKVRDRRRLLREVCEIDESRLRNIDFVDAALCAYAAECFARDDIQVVGNPGEGYIVLPKGVRRLSHTAKL